MLSFANPWAFFLLAFLVPVVLLYFLRMRFKRQPIGSAFIWRRLADKNSGGNRLRLRSLLLLLLQMAAVGLAAISAAGPTLESRTLLKPGTAFILDASASMACRGSGAPGESRLDVAKRMAADDLAALPPGAPAAVFAGSSSFQRIWSGKAGPEGARAIASIRQEEGAFLEDEAALGIAPELASRQGAWQAVVYSDGGMDLGGRRLALAFEDAIEFRNIDSGEDDSGVSGLVVAAAAAGGTASFTLRNGSVAAIARRLSLKRDGQEIATAEASIAPGQSRSSLAFAGRAEQGAYEIAFAGSDAYALNDSSRFVLSERRPLSVLLVGPKNAYIQAAMAYQGITAANMESLPDKIDADEWDFVIVSGPGAKAGIACSMAVFGPLPADAPGQARYTVTGLLSSAATEHPLARFLRWDEGALATGEAIEPEPGAEAIATIKGAPVMIAWERDGFRYFGSTVDLESSDLGRSQAFPILMRNLIQWFVPGAAGFTPSALRVGEGAWLSEGSSLTVADKRVAVTQSGSRAFVTARASGVYEWKALGRSGFLAVNIPESELDPSPRPVARPDNHPVLSSTFSVKRQGLMRLPILLLLLCLAAEWFLWSGLPSLKRGLKAEARR
jgi:Ca-activated chloride channel homolog